MLVRIFLALLIGLGVAGLGGAVLIATHKDRPGPVAAAVPAPTPAPPVQIAMLVAARDVRAGSLLVPEDLAAKQIPPDALPPGATRDSTEARSALLGAMVRRTLQAGQPILADGVLSPGDRGFLAAVLAPGTRAVTVGVDSVSGTAGLIWPGDRVDLILTETIDEQGQPLPHRIAGETVLTDVRVIAVDQNLVQGGQASAGLHAEQNRTITLEVTPGDAERVAVSTRLGRLALVVRSASRTAGPPSDVQDGAHRDAVTAVTNSKPDPVQIVWGGDVSKALRSEPNGKAGAAVRVFRGTQEAVEFKF